MLSYFVYFEIKLQNMVTIGICVEYMCIWL